MTETSLEKSKPKILQNTWATATVSLIKNQIFAIFLIKSGYFFS